MNKKRYQAPHITLIHTRTAYGLLAFPSIDKGTDDNVPGAKGSLWDDDEFFDEEGNDEGGNAFWTDSWAR